MEFQAETRQLLDIVTHSLYTDKEVFLRELVSNASDALEKLRHVMSSGANEIVDPDMPLEIRIETDEEAGTITITDTGIGLTKEDMVSHLGTIARSGSKNFVKELQKGAEEGAGGNSAAAGASSGKDLGSIIGKFGVGFYSAFMVGDKVEVRSRSAYKSHESISPPKVWSSSGLGTYSISDLPSDIRQDRGASVVIHLPPEQIEYCDEKRVTSILKKYSNFVGFPIYLNGTKVNTLEAVWTMSPSEVTEETHAEFYKYIANAFDEPLMRLHFRADAPIDIKALFYVPSFHQEKGGMGRLEPGVSLYSRKVLIEAKSPDILPDWLRFIKGVVDSEDLPLSISREKPQDTALIQKLKKALTRKFISHLAQMAKREPQKYKDEFYREYGYFLKEGICQDHEFQDQIAKLLYFESNKTLKGELSSIEEYISRMKPGQKDIYYLCAPNRKLAYDSPYLEAFDRHDHEVLFIYSAIDDFVMNNLVTFENRNLISAEKSDITFKDEDKTKDKDDGDDKDSSSSTSALTKDQSDELCQWFQKTFPSQIKLCRTTTRLSTSPAIVTDHESGSLRSMMRMLATEDGASTEEGGNHAPPIQKQTMELNPNHEIIKRLYDLKDREPALARTIGEQVFDNCLVAAGLLDDGRVMLPRLNDLLLCVLKGAAAVEDVKRQQGADAVAEGPAVGWDRVKYNIPATDEAQKKEEEELLEAIIKKKTTEGYVPPEEREKQTLGSLAEEMKKKGEGVTASQEFDFALPRDVDDPAKIDPEQVLGRMQRGLAEAGIHPPPPTKGGKDPLEAIEDLKEEMREELKERRWEKSQFEDAEEKKK